MKVFKLFAVTIGLMLLTTVVYAENWYVDPQSKDMSGNGSQSKPWRTLAEVVKTKLINAEIPTKGKVGAGDTILLLNGDHGDVTMTTYIGGLNASTPVTVMPAPGHKPTLSRLTVRGIGKWTFKNLTFTLPENTLPALYYTFVTFSDTNDIVFDNNDLYTVKDATAWTPEDWDTKSVFKAISFSGVRGKVTNNRVKNVGTGISIGGDNVQMTGNSIEYFSQDSLQCTANNASVSRNVVTDHYSLREDGHHNDGFQAWTVKDSDGKEIPGFNLSVDSNIIISSTGKYKNLPIIGSGVGSECFQGISIYNGAWSSVRITNNLVITSAYNGLTMAGVSKLTIQNNTILTYATTPTVIGWIAVANHKDGSIPTKVTVTNNIATRFSFSTPDVVATNNISLGGKNIWGKTKAGVAIKGDPLNKVGSLTDVFVDFNPTKVNANSPLPIYNLHLRPGSPAIGYGLPTALKDLDGKSRVIFDCGCYSFIQAEK